MQSIDPFFWLLKYHHRCFYGDLTQLAMDFVDRHEIHDDRSIGRVQLATLLDIKLRRILQESWPLLYTTLGTFYFGNGWKHGETQLNYGFVKLTNDDVATNTYSMLVFCRRATNSAVRFSSYEKAHKRQQRPFILLEWPFRTTIYPLINVQLTHPIQQSQFLLQESYLPTATLAFLAKEYRMGSVYCSPIF
ncbi:hypothetical protein OUZ56_000746 [Daphnia magna]|uniref:Uncharacterized protein n=1 Tax=Daphnia magna TaxID=35525 RepID=A0ABR0A0T1_9CRUS|nr:hypothetical protein OUZ56_000746 [Daphnia magna]